MSSQDTRNVPRRDIKVTIRIKPDGDGTPRQDVPLLTPSHLATINISVLGLGFFSDTRLAQHAHLALEMDGRPLGLPGMVTINGSVRYCIAFGEVLYRCGIRFIDIPEEVCRKVEEYVLAA